MEHEIKITQLHGQHHIKIEHVVEQSAIRISGTRAEDGENSVKFIIFLFVTYTVHKSNKIICLKSQEVKSVQSAQHGLL